MSKLISEFKIGFDAETKAEINALKGKLDEVARALTANNDSHADKLLAVMQAGAANDAPEHELKELGQWVFEGEDEKWESGAIDKNGDAYLYNCKKNILRLDYHGVAHKGDFDTCLKPIGSGFDTANWKDSAINRETVNDVEYLSNNNLDESVPHIDDVLAQPNWLSDSVPQITKADLQLIFIKNLSEVLIQRMHSMDRFSEDDYAIGGKKLMPWDIVIDSLTKNIGIVTGGVKSKDRFTLCFITPAPYTNNVSQTHCWEIKTVIERHVRTITESELPAFRAALEACYV